MKALLDTHILLWWFEGGKRLSNPQRKVIAEAHRQSPLCVSEISLWEIATLFQLGRIQLHLPLRDWLDQATAPERMLLCQGERIISTAHRGQKTNMGNRNQSW